MIREIRETPTISNSSRREVNVLLEETSRSCVDCVNLLILLKNFAQIPVRAIFIALLSFVITTKAGNAAIVGLNNSDSYISPGSNTIASLGYQLTGVTDSTASDNSLITSLGSPDGDLNFTSPLQKLTVPTSFGTWSHNYTGPVYLSSGSSDTINLPDGITAFDLYIEPNTFATANVTASAVGNSTPSSTTQSVKGDGGAEYFGFYSNSGEQIKTVAINVAPPADVLGNPTFAIGELRVNSATAVPESSFVLSILTFGILGATHKLKRQKSSRQCKSVSRKSMKIIS